MRGRSGRRGPIERRCRRFSSRGAGGHWDGVAGRTCGRCHRLRLQARRGGVRPTLLQDSDEAIAQRVVGLDVARMLGIVVQGRAQLGDGPGQHARGDVAMAPDLVEQFIAAQQLARTAQQDQQYGESLGLQRLGLALAQQGMGRGIHLDGIEAIAPERATISLGAIARLHRRFLTPPS